MHTTAPLFPRALTVLIALAVLSGAAFAAPTTSTRFDVPAGDATATLKQFAEQSGQTVVYLVDTVRGIRTNAVKGNLSPLDALNRMVADTELSVVQDAKTGALALKRVSDPNGPRAAQKDSVRPDQDKIENDKLMLEKIEVTGTKETGIVNQGVISREENQAIRFEVFNRRDIERSGATSLSELFFRQIPSITSAGTGTQRTFAFASSFSTGFGTTTDALNFRGLGTNRTLTLVNGRRLYSGEAAGADVSRFPIAAIDRIELLPGSASAIYGGNAVGGVVNVILRKDYQGGEGRTYVGTSTRGGAAEFQGSYFQGILAHNGKTRISASVDYVHKESLLAGERSFYLRAINAIPSSNPGYLTEIAQNFVGSRATLASTTNLALGIPGSEAATYAGVPAGSTGTGLNPNSFATTAARATVSDQRVRRGILLPASDTYSGFLVMERQLTKAGLEAYLELGYRYSTYAESYPGFMPTVTLSATSTLNPFRTGVIPGFVGKAVRVSFDPVDLPDANTESLQRAYRVVGGLKGKLSDNNWHWSADTSWDLTNSRALTVDYLRFLGAAVNAGIYNPLRDLATQPMQTAGEQEKYASRRESLTKPEIAAFNLRMNGDLADLPGGPLAFSFGGEGRFETDYSVNNFTYGAYSTLAGASTTASSRSVNSRRVLSAYTEVTAPVIGDRNQRAWLRRLEFSVAARFESFDDFGEATSPMVAVKVEPLAGLILRGSYSEGFLPPSQSSLFAGVITSPAATATFVDPRRPGQPRGPITQTSGGNPGLNPEQTKSVDVGIVLQHPALTGFTLSASYYRYDTSDRIVTPTLQNIIDWETIFPGRVQRAVPTAADVAAGWPGQLTGIDRTQINVARLVTDGLDLRASYRMPTESGVFTVNASGTAGFSYRTQSVAGAANVDTQGDIGDGRSTYPPLNLRGQVGVRWERDRYSASWTGRYTSEYQTNSTRPTAVQPNKTGYDGTAIDPTFEMDLQFSYRVPYSGVETKGWRRWLGGTQWTLGCMNVLDREPPYITTNLGWYSLFSDPRGRFAYLQVKKSF